MRTSAALPREPWKKRLVIPSYHVQEAARYARTSPQTIRHWQSGGDLVQRAISTRDPRAALSYMQLIEVAVVAAFRKAGIKLAEIRASREYLANVLKSEYPFAQFDFKTSGRSILMDYSQVDKKHGKGKLLEPGRGGQLAWDEIIGGLLKEFEYDKKLALKWHVAGAGAPIIIDPRIAFGAPNVNGVPTWILKGRWEAGEDVREIADDFSLPPKVVNDALRFEGIDTAGQKEEWVH